MADNNNLNFDEINQSAGFAFNSFELINKKLKEIKENSSGIARELEGFVSSTSAVNTLADKLKTTTEKDLKSRKELRSLESATEKAQKEIQKITIEINVFSQRRLKATKEEKKEIDKILRAKGDQLDNAKLLVSSANELLEVSKNQTSSFKTITDEMKKIQGINSLLSLSFFGLQMLKISEQTAQFQKSLLLSADQAKTLRQEFVATANASGDNFITTNKLIEANAALGKQLGFNKNFGADLNTEFVNLTKRVGLSEEAASGFAKASIISGKSLKSTAETASGIVSSVSSQYGIQLDIKDVLNEAGTSSALMLSNFKGSTDALVQGVSQMKALGTSLAQTDQQAASLLDFQSSIENTLKASLFTGRQINIEKARELALNNDLTGVAEELSKQQMSFSEFGKMNRIQQDAFAQSLGLTRDTLSDQLLKQAVQKKSQSEIVALYGEEAYKRSQTLNTQEKFNAAVEKMSDLFGNLAAGPLGAVADLLGKMAESALLVSTAIGVIAAVQLNSLLATLAKSAVSMGLLAVESIAAGSALTLGIGGIAIAAGIAAAVASYKATKSDDLMSGYGNRTLVTPQGSYALNNNDTVIAGTNLFKGNDVYSGPKDSINLGGSIDYDKLASAMSKVQVVSQVRVSEFGTPITTYQQQNMRRSV
jgi:hypothetical protein